MSGWIKLHRDIEKHWIWSNPQYLQGWIYCIIRANYEENKVLIGTKIEVAEPGSFFTSIGKFSIATGLSIQQTRTFWDLLEDDTMINKKATSKRTKITICNYDKYQVKQQTNNKPITNEQQTNNNGEEREEVKEVKEEEDECIIPEPKTRGPNKKITPNQFNIFWKIYPGKKSDKGKCLSKWKTMCGWKGETPPTWFEIKKAISTQSKTDRWKKGMIPLPHTWLNQRRWLDDPKQMNDDPSFRPRAKPDRINHGTKEKGKYEKEPDIKEI